MFSEFIFSFLEKARLAALTEEGTVYCHIYTKALIILRTRFVFTNFSDQNLTLKANIAWNFEIRIWPKSKIALLKKFEHAFINFFPKQV